MPQDVEYAHQEGYPNLRIPTSEQAREMGRKGGQKSAENRKRRKTFAEGLKELLSMPEDDPQVRAVLVALGLDGTMQDAINLAQAMKAKRGDVEAFRAIRDTVGEKPRDGLEIGGLADRPIAHIDMSKLTDDQLRALAEQKAEHEG